MKKMLFLILLIVGTVIVTIGIEVGIVMGVGKEKLASMPIIGSAFTVAGDSEAVVEVDDPRYKEVDEMVANLKNIIAEKEALQKEQTDTNERLKDEIKRLQAEITAMNNEMSSRLLMIEKHRLKGIQETAKKYESMDPQAVATIFRELDDKECAEILMFMKDRQAAKIIEAYTNMGEDEIARSDNAKKMADIMKILQKLVREEEEEG